MARSKQLPSSFHRVKAGLEDSIHFSRGELNLRTITLPAPPPALQAADVVCLRQRCGMSQRQFARMLNVSARTVQAWERGDRRPTQAALRLVQVFQACPQAVCEAVGLPELP
jgi:putative transcriptional regulator